MQTREILEAFRKGNINEKTITRFMMLLNERIDTLEKNTVELARAVESMSKFFDDQLRMQVGMNRWIEGVAKALNIDPETVSKINSEEMENRPHILMPGDNG